MAFEVVWHPSASNDFDEVIDYVSQQFGWAASKKLYDEVLETVNRISAFPEIGVLSERITYLGNEVRIFNIRQNSIVYSIGGTQITIIVFWNNRQNPAQLKTIVSSR